MDPCPHALSAHTNSTHTNSTHTNSTHTNSTHTNSTHTNSTHADRSTRVPIPIGPALYHPVARTQNPAAEHSQIGLFPPPTCSAAAAAATGDPAGAAPAAVSRAVGLS